MPSLWKAESEPRTYLPLRDDAACDLLVIGSGIAGLSCAYEAARFGAKVIVIDRGDITGAMTARTTAHLATEIDDRYFDLIRAVGEDNARLYHESQSRRSRGSKPFATKKASTPISSECPAISCPPGLPT